MSFDKIDPQLNLSEEEIRKLVRAGKLPRLVSLGKRHRIRRGKKLRAKERRIEFLV